MDLTDYRKEEKRELEKKLEKQEELAGEIKVPEEMTSKISSFGEEEEAGGALRVLQATTPPPPPKKKTLLQTTTPAPKSRVVATPSTEQKNKESTMLPSLHWGFSEGWFR